MRFFHVIINTLFIAGLAFAADVRKDGPNLSADIGATKSRYMILPRDYPKELESLATLSKEVISCDSVQPLCTENVMKALPNDASVRESLTCVSIGLPCPCENNYLENSQLKDLKEKLCGRYGSECEIVLCNDAINWLKGAFAFDKLYRSKDAEVPTLMIVLGTAVGLAYFDGSRVISLELSEFTIPYDATRKLLKLERSTPIGKYAQYQMVGRFFWEERGANTLNDAIKRFKSEGDEKIQFCLLVDAFRQDVVQTLKKSYEIESVIVGGGNARYIDSLKEAIVLNDKELQGVASVIIPLLHIYY